ncbi:MAG: hypothetical protein WAV90_09705, partial [Gordonia amarae]
AQAETFRVSGVTAAATVVTEPVTVAEPECVVGDLESGRGLVDASLAEAFADLPDPYAPELEAAVFEFLPQLRDIREAARGGAISPWSVLGITIGRGLLRVAPAATLPPLVGNRPAPLNLQIGIVGASGRGKGVACSTVDYDSSTSQGWDARFKPPSGAALANLFVKHVKGEDGEITVEQVREAAWCDWSEVDSLTSTVKRGGNDLGSELRAAISGEELGTDPKMERHTPLKVAAMIYRILISMSVQYGEPAAPLMAERDGGTLQRTVWFGTADPGRYTEWVEGRTRWTQLSIQQRLPGDQQHFTVDRDIQREVWEAQSASIASDTGGDGLDGHRNLNRLKIAAWAAMIQHRGHIGAPEWDWAGAVMEHSDRIRAQLDASVRNLKVKQAREFGELDHERNKGKDGAAVREAARMEKLASSMAKKMATEVQAGNRPECFSANDVAMAMGTGPRRDNADKLIPMLVERGVWGSDGKRFWVLQQPLS